MLIVKDNQHQGGLNSYKLTLNIINAREDFKTKNFVTIQKMSMKVNFETIKDIFY